MRINSTNAHFNFFLPILCLALITACSTTPTQPPTSNDIDTGNLISPTPTRLPAAEAAELEEDYETAAQLYLAASHNLPAPNNHAFQLKAAQLFVQANLIEQAHEQAQALSSVPLQDRQIEQLTLIHAQIALSQNLPEPALQYLDSISPDNLASSDQERYLNSQAQAYIQLEQPENAFTYLSQLLEISEPNKRSLIETLLWNTLTQTPSNKLEELKEQLTSADDLGWLELTNIFHSYSTLSTRIDLQIEQWHSKYPQHPASIELITSIKTLQSEIIFQPQTIAILLPQSGPFARAGEAIKTGIIAAFMNQNNNDYQPELRFYDTGEMAEQALNTYDRAVHEGADLIIGPLSKGHVSSLANREALAVPTLALNSISTDITTENLFLFGLPPEDEAQQVAEKAWLDGYNHALTLVPEGKWGERLSNMFSMAWKNFGGQSIETQRFDPSAQDFSKPLQALLNLDESQKRIRDIKWLLGQEVRTEPRRRQDVDFIFLAATPQQARQIRPQLKFFYAENIPIYATSHLYTGMLNPEKDHDMNDILFCDMPWVLNPSSLWQNIHAHWPKLAPSYKRLYALGLDSYNIVPHLRRLSAYKFQYFSGYTGNLSIDSQQRVNRELLWARFVNGKAIRLADDS